MAFTSFRAGSGSYQAVRPLLINASAVNAGATQKETFSVAQGNIAASGGSIADLTTDSLVYAQFANPNAASIAGLIIDAAFISATGELSLVFFNPTGSTITPAAGLQLNLIVF